MKRVDLIGVMLEELKAKYSDYLRLRDEFDRTRAERELACKRAKLLQNALGDEKFRQGVEVDPLIVQAGDLLCSRG